MIAPARSQAGRGAAKSSSITHWRNGSVITAPRSSMPSAAAIAARSAAVVAGVIRSTIVDGKRTLSSIQASSSPACGSRSAKSRTSPASTRPLSGRLSQHTTVIGAPFARRRASSPRASCPTTVDGPLPLRSAAIPGSSRRRRPVVAS